MQTVPLVRSSSLLPVVRFLERGGGALRGVRERAQPVFRGPESLIPVVYGGALLEEAARASGLADLGFRVGCETRIESFGEWGAIVAHCGTPAAFLQAVLAQHRRFNTGFRFWTVGRGEEVWLHQRYVRSLREGRRQAVELSLLIVLAALRAVLGPTWRPVEIHLEGDPPAHAEELAALAIRRVSFGRPETAIAIPRALLAQRSAGWREPGPWTPGGPEPAEDFAGSVRQAVSALLRLGALDLAVAAEAAGMSERSFQRRLGEAGLRFSEVVEQVRFEAACRLLTDPQRRVIDVSTELGYGDAANFTRAFRRWAGVPPQLYRRVNAPPGRAAAG